MSLARICIAFLVVMVFVVPLGIGSGYIGLAECQGGFGYLVEADNGGHYALLGLPSALRTQYANHTIRIFVNGTYYPSKHSVRLIYSFSTVTITDYLSRSPLVENSSFTIFQLAWGGWFGALLFIALLLPALISTGLHRYI